MTAVNVVIEWDKAHLFTDSAACDPFGRVWRLVSKVRVLPGGRCAFAMRGRLKALDAIAEILSTLGTDVDELRAAAEDGRLRAVLSPWRQALRGRLALARDYDVTIIGWGKDGPTAFMFWNHGKMRSDDGAAVPPRFAPHDIARANVLPPVPLPRGALRDPLAAMPEIMRRQHMHREPSILFPKGRRFVGGFIEHTIMTAAGVETRRAGGWDDPLGKPIGGGADHWKALRRGALIFGAAWCGLFALSFGWQVVRALGSGQGLTW